MSTDTPSSTLVFLRRFSRGVLFLLVLCAVYFAVGGDFHATATPGGLVNGEGTPGFLAAWVAPVNLPPTADAGPDRTVNEGFDADLDGRNSTDPDGDTLTFSWSCTGGTLSDSTSSRPSWHSPQVSSDTPYTCSLTVSDGRGGAASDTMVITVEDVASAVNGQCSATHYNCSAGTSASNVDGNTAWTWNCNGVNGGTNASCSEQKLAAQTSGVRLRALLDGAAWSGNITIDALHNSNPCADVAFPFDWNGAIIASQYGYRYCTGGPSGATFTSVTPSEWQSTEDGVTKTWTFNFTSPPAGSIGLSGVGSCNGTTPQVTLSWNDITGTVGYDLERCQSAGCSPAGSVYRQLSSTGAPTQTYVDSSLLQAVNRYRVHSRSPDVASNVVEVAKPNCTAAAVCGNGVAEGAEQCDDGNLVNGDGCSSTCQLEPVSPFQMSVTGRCDGSRAEVTSAFTPSVGALSYMGRRVWDSSPPPNGDGILSVLAGDSVAGICLSIFNPEFSASWANGRYHYTDTGLTPERLHSYSWWAYRTSNCTGSLITASTPPSIRITTPACPIVPPVGSPSCTLSAQPSSIQRGGSSTLSWTSANASSGSINNGVGAMSPLTSGSKSVSPTSNTTYTATVIGTDGTSSAQCSATVTVTNPPNPVTADLFIRKLNDPPSGAWGPSAAITVGEDVELRWDSSNADQCIGTGFTTSLPPNNFRTSGTTTPARPSSDRSYTVDCRNSSSSDDATVTVDVTGPPGSNVDIWAVPRVVDYGTASTLYWRLDGNTGCTVSGTNGHAPAANADNLAGVPTRDLFGETRYDLTCPGGTDFETIRVRPQFEEI